MSDLLVLSAFLAFAVFLLARQHPYAAIAGWGCIVLNLWSELPAFFREDNFLYPALALLALPFLAITAGRLLQRDPVVLRLSRTAAIATLIWVPFALVPPLRDALVSVTITLAFGLITALGHHPQLLAWDIMAENGFVNQIIPGCTGITAIAMMLGVAFGEEHLTRRQGGLALLLIVPPVCLLNLLRVAVVFIAVSGRWFAGFPDPTGTGDANFFWAHNVIAEGLAVLFLLLLVWALCRVIPTLGDFARALMRLYPGRCRAWLTAFFRR
jgi:archaeosortase A